MAGLRSVILLVILGATLVAARSDPWARSRNRPCPQTAINANLSDPDTFKTYQRRLIHDMWRRDHLRDFSDDALQLADMMKTIANGDDEYQRSVAYLHASWASHLLQRTNLKRQPCIFVEVRKVIFFQLTSEEKIDGGPNVSSVDRKNVWANLDDLKRRSTIKGNTPYRMINSAITFEEYEDANPAARTLRRYARGIHDMCLRAADGALQKVKCPGLNQVPILKAKCDWKRYDIKKAWNLFGGGLPIEMRKLVKSLYRSNTPVDKLLAIMMTVSITPLMQDIYFAHDQQYLLEIVDFLTSYMLAPKCCEQRKRRLLELCKFRESDTLKDVKCLTKHKYTSEPVLDRDYISN